MKSCLKCKARSSSIRPGPFPGPSSSPSSSTQRPKWSRRVSFREKCEDEVHTADEWDRTAVDVVPKLTYEDILELKEMQLAAAKACARATEAKGMTPKYLSNVPLGLLPLLPAESNAGATTSPPTSPRSFSPPPQHNLNALLGNGTGNGAEVSPAGLSLAEACLCRVFSADTGLPVTKEHGHHHTCGKERDYSSVSSSGVSLPAPTREIDDPRRSNGQPHFKLVSSVHQIPSPPDTPPRLSVTSIPPPPPTRKARQFAFLPLLDASSSSSSSPAMSLTSSPVGSGMSSPSSPRNGAPVPPVSLSASLSALCPKTSPPFSSSSSSASPASSSSSTPSNGAYTEYDPYGRSTGVGGNATLGLERRLGFKFESDSETSSEGVTSEEDEDDGWPRDWPGRHPHSPRQHSSSTHSHLHSHSHSRSNHAPPGHRHKDVRSDRNGSGSDKRDKQQSPSSKPKLPPSPPTESDHPLPLSIPPSISSTIPPNNTLTPKNLFSSPRDSSSSSSPRTSPSRKSSPSPCSVRRGVHTSSPSPPTSSSSSSTSSPRMRKNKMALPLVTLA